MDKPSKAVVLKLCSDTTGGTWVIQIILKNSYRQRQKITGEHWFRPSIVLGLVQQDSNYMFILMCIV